MHLRRRTALAWLGTGLLGSRMGLASAAAAPDPDERAAGLFLLAGSGGEPNPGNLGRTGNSGFIVGRNGVLVVDTGASLAHGRSILEAIRGTTDKPVRLAIVTHASPEFAFGAAAFRDQKIPLAMPQGAAAVLASRGEGWLQTLTAQVGAEAMRGTAVVRPDITFTDPMDLDAAAMIQRSVQLLSFGRSSGPGDIGVYEPRSGTFFAGGLADVQRIPDLTDADLPGWRDALGTLWALPIEEVLPGHGKPGTKRLIGQTDTYLAKLAERVQTLREAGTPASEIAQAATLPEFQAWDGYLTRHPRNAALLYERGSNVTSTSR